MRSLLFRVLLGLALGWLLADVLRFLLARPVWTAVVFALAVVGAYGWCYARKGEV